MNQQQQEVNKLQGLNNFPTNFFWGAGTSAYQIEGATQEDGRGRTIWDDFARTPGKTFQGETGDTAVDHYHRFKEDVALMKELGITSYCFSIAWSRIFPDGVGTMNNAGLDFYQRLIDTLLAHDIIPIAKLYHWDLPSALQDQGGWLKRSTAYAFADYAEAVTSRLGDRVNQWITHNEPWCSSYLGHALGVHAPGLQDLQLSVSAAHHILLSHGLAIPRIRSHIAAEAKVGIVLDYYPLYAADDQPETQIAVQKADDFRNGWFFEPIFKQRYPENLFSDLGVHPPHIEENDLAIIATPIDFLGLNYYTRWVIRSTNTPPPMQPAFEQVKHLPDASYTAMGWEIYPEGLFDALTTIQQKYQPTAIFVTENGAAFPDIYDGDKTVHDPQRVKYLQEHIASVGQAAAHGVPVQGYFVWSLVDNYEWAEGYNKRFGIVYVDFSSQKRIIKDSGHWYTFLINEQQKGRF